jgi:sarcosine oxidase subunit delta
MLLIDCPHCGPRAQIEFAYERPLDGIVPLDASPDAAMRTLYHGRANPRGVDEELWRHAFGCRQFLVMQRDRVSHAILSTAAWQAP